MDRDKPFSSQAAPSVLGVPRRRRVNWLRIAAHVVGLLPLAWILLDYVRGPSFTFEREVMLRTGTVALVLLIASFACSPLAALLSLPPLTQIRRALGLYAFLYICLHLFTYALAESGFDWELVQRDLTERRAMSVGLAAFLALIPLALTSTRGWQRRLGKQWRTLHSLVYIAVPLSVLHLFWLERDFIEPPLIYGGVVLVLFTLRLPLVRRALRRKPV